MSDIDRPRPFPPLYDTLMGLKSEVFKGLRCCVPGSILKVNDDNTVDVQVGFLQQDASGLSYPYPTLGSCPLFTLQGGGIAAAFPVKTGDECLVLFSDRCIDAWLQTGSPQPLPNLRMHDLSDGFALVGVNSVNSILDLALLTGEGGIADATAKIAIKNGFINISNGPLPVNSLGGILGTFFTATAAATTVPQIAAAAATAKASLATLLY